MTGLVFVRARGEVFGGRGVSRGFAGRALGVETVLALELRAPENGVGAEEVNTRTVTLAPAARALLAVHGGSKE